MNTGNYQAHPCATLDLPATKLLSRSDLRQRWQCGSHAFFQRAEADGLLVARRYGGRPGYRWDDVFTFEGGLPPKGLEEAYRADLITPDDLAAYCPFQPMTLIRKASAGEIPHRRVGRFIRFVPYEAQRWLRSWS
nr:helix-turn-helix domain-containing protein [uncultured Roseovarius sp.]